MTQEVHWTDALRKRVIPRPEPGTAKLKRKPLAKTWAEVRKDFEKLSFELEYELPSNIQRTSPDTSPLRARYEEMSAARDVFDEVAPPASLDLELQGIAVALYGALEEYGPRARKSALRALFELWREVEGVEFAPRAMAEALKWRRTRSYEDKWCLQRQHAGAHEELVPSEYMDLVPGGWLDLRAWLSTLTPEEFERARDAATALRAEASHLVRSGLSCAFADASWAREDWAQLSDYPSSWHRSALLLLFGLDANSTDDVVAFLRDERIEEISDKLLPYLLLHFEGQAPAVIDALHRRRCVIIPGRNQDTRATQKKVFTRVLEHIGVVESASASRWLLDASRRAEVEPMWLEYAGRHPNLVARTLLEDTTQERAESVLSKLTSHHPSWLESLEADLSAGLLSHIGGGTEAPSEPVEAGGLEAILRGPETPHLRHREAVQMVLAMEEGPEQQAGIERVCAWSETFPASNFAPWPGAFDHDHPTLAMISWMSPSDPAPFALSHLSNVRELSFYKGKNATLLASAGASHLTRLRSLNLSSNRLRRKLCVAFADSAWAGTLERMNLNYAKFDKGAFAALLGTEGTWPGLQALELLRPELPAGENALELLAARTDGWGLEELTIRPRDPAALRTFLASPLARGLTRLSCRIESREVFEVFVDSGIAGGLTHLNLSTYDGWIRETSYDALWSTLGASSSLTSLSLLGVPAEPAVELFESVSFEGLDTLYVSLEWNSYPVELVAPQQALRQRLGELWMSRSWPKLRALGFAQDTLPNNQDTWVLPLLCSGQFPALEYFQYPWPLDDQDLERLAEGLDAPSLKLLHHRGGLEQSEHQIAAAINRIGVDMRENDTGLDPFF